ncbi:MAG: methionyl-tRNA formyltransferase [Eubacteriaceae bacterium]|nr:methionyl-tRNA formyltransferase [Eubacteriaceae bacterium]MDK2904080.1 methionyl-tRNA formyltransferase [Eubacteriaceae bacterium]MDK2935784.1 methionyl-tRNA formyltransferase [Eubacteriaceae bacterium]MDK2961107.1 methionyl-tRNA formyltransferase [Eubacteriaceae bacterium]
MVCSLLIGLKNRVKNLMKKYKIIFLGTTEFGEPALKRLIDDGHAILSVFCQPDRPNRRGKKIEYLPIKKLALEHDCLIYQPENINDQEMVEIIRLAAPDFLIVAAYGQKLSPEILEIPKFGALNIHGSILPKYRGAAPIQRAIINGDKKTGVTIMKMAEGMDTGDMYITGEIEINKRTSYGGLHKDLSDLGSQLLCDHLEEIANKSLVGQKQNDADATYAEKIDKAMGALDWSRPGQVLVSLINGLDPQPGAYFYLENNKVKCFSPVFEKKIMSLPPGQVVESDLQSGFAVSVSDGLLWIEEIQYPGKKRMAVKDFLRGKAIKPGTLLNRLS